MIHNQPSGIRRSLNRYDIIIIGTGAGGGTIAQALSQTSARILIVERGDFVPQEEENWDPEAVWKHLRYRAREKWLDDRGREFTPYTHYGVGGNTKFWGSVLYRLRREDFQAIEHLDGVSPAWPIDYDTLAPYYDRAERCITCRGADGRSHRTTARALSIRGRAPRAANGGHRRSASCAGAPPIAAPARAAQSRRGRRLHPLQHVQFVRVQTAREERSRCVLRPAGAVAVERDAVDQCDGHAVVTDPSGRRVEAVDVDAQRRDGPRARAARHRVVRRGQFGGAAAAIGERQASGGPGEFLRPRRAPATWRTSRR